MIHLSFFLLQQIINSAMRKEKIELCIGVLDIYGFEIFEVYQTRKLCFLVFFDYITTK